MKKLDMLFIHPPARVQGSMHTLDADVGFTDQFVAIPAGFFSMADQLEKAGYNVRIKNLGERVYVTKKSIDTLLTELFSQYHIEVVGIDIHWMIHSAGAIATAQAIKKISPGTKVILGGISASYFSKEIVEKYPAVDYVMKGECDDAIVDLIKELKKQDPHLPGVSNLVYNDNGNIRQNPVKLPDVSETLQVLRYDLLMEEAVINPRRSIITMDRGCTRNCCFCAGARESFGHIMGRKKPGCLKPTAIIRLIEESKRRGRDKIYLYGDIGENGPAYIDEFFKLLDNSTLTDAHLVLEFFSMPKEDFIRRWKEWADRSGNTIEATHSPESGSQEVRKIVGKNYTNQDLLDYCKMMVKYDIPQSIYFLLGLPGQTKETVDETLELSEKIVEIYSAKFSYDNLQHEVVSFNFMQIPDAGSMVFRNPDAFGFKLDFQDIETLIYKLKNAENWTETVSYSTDKLSKEQLIELHRYIQDSIRKIYQKHGMLSHSKN